MFLCQAAGTKDMLLWLLLPTLPVHVSYMSFTLLQIKNGPIWDGVNPQSGHPF